ncbi:MAG: DUF721 domain-containing protein [Hyphomicrobiaceae bacterium]|nr:DUF721 domain-containing protein [Hyphomicrobiaceae bacterium]
MRVKPLRQNYKSSKKVCSLGALVSDITKRAFEKYGFCGAAILTDWNEIIGDDLAAATSPVRLKWPRNSSIPWDANTYSQNSEQGATLILRTKPSHALDVQYNSYKIKKRINAYFGYHAVSQIRILQAPINQVSEPVQNFDAAKQVTKLCMSSEGIIHYDNFDKDLSCRDKLIRSLARLKENIRVNSEV